MLAFLKDGADLVRNPYNAIAPTERQSAVLESRLESSMMMYRFTALQLGLALLVASTTWAQSFRQSSLGRYPNVRSTNDLIEQWNPNQHLYVKGELGIGARQLDDLESWLDENAPHWTVFLCRTARDEVYRSLEQRTYRGLDAVEYALGRGLALRTNFSDLRHPLTGETDGAVFVLCLDERTFSYYASVAQDVRSLGESRWVGELDRPAFRAMRGGGRILDAVKDTVINVNTRLEKRISAEREQAEREAQSRQRAVVNLQTDIDSLFQNIELAKQKAGEIQAAFPTAEGELTTPPTEAWERMLNEVAGFLTLDTVAESRDKFQSVSHEVEGYLNAYADYESFESRVKQIQTEINEIQADPLLVGRPKAQEASQHIQDATSLRENGNKGIGAKLADAQQTISEGRAAVAAEAERLAKLQARRKLVRTTIMITAGVLSLAFLGILLWLNRRRAPAKTRAETALAEREEMVAEEMEKVYQLFDRSGEILGNKEKVRQRGYVGSTKKLTDHAFEDVDDLFVMSSEVERVMDEAREMIRPKQAIGRVANLVSAARYERGVNRISGEPLQFHRDKGLPLVIQRESERTGAEPPEEVTMTFDKVFEAFHERTKTAQETLNTVEHSLLEVDDRLKALQEQIETTSALDQELSAAADDDGFFEIPVLFEKLIPSAQEDFDKADQIAATDPVAAIQDLIPQGVQKMSDALAIIGSLQHGRQQVFPKLNDVAPQLQESGYTTDWIQQHVSHLGTQANELLEDALDRPVMEEASQFDIRLRSFGQRVERTLELARDLKQKSGPALEDLEQRIAAARSTIADKLGITADRCLCEFEANPDQNQTAAREQFAAAQAALHHGEVEAAATAQATLQSEVDTGLQRVARSLEVLERFERSQRERREQLDTVQDKVPRHAELLDEVQAAYAKAALSLQSADPAFEDPAATVVTHLALARDALHDASGLINEASTKYADGRLLEADNMLHLAQQHGHEADALLNEIGQHCSKLKTVSRENEGKLATMQRNIESQESQVLSAKTTRSTITFYETIRRELKTAQDQILYNAPRDPFEDGRAIDRFDDSLRELIARVESDHESHAEAARAVAGARAKRNVAEQLIQQSRHDGIPDSPATKAGVRDVQMYDEDLARVERELNESHHDWKNVDQLAARIHGELGVKVGRLRGELDRAQRLVAVFQTASDTVFEATRWTGGFGTRIFGSPGSNELERARQALNSGDYSAMAELARAAQIAAQHAIQRAQREVYRRQREEARRQEAARRRRRNSMNTGGNIPGISLPSSRGGSRGSSGGGRPSTSRGTTGSGFSRSGW